MKQKTKENILYNFVIFAFALIFFTLGIVFYHHALDDNYNRVLGSWINRGEERFVQVRIDNVALNYNITDVIKHEIGHEIYYLIYSDDECGMTNEEFARMCEDDIDKCVEMLIEYDKQKST